MNKNDIALERDLYAVLDLLRPRLGRTWEVFQGEIGEHVEVITYDSTSAGYLSEIGIHEFHQTNIVARISGTLRFEDFEACLQVHRVPESLDQIVDVRWTCRNAAVAQEWARNLVTSGRMDGLRRLRPSLKVVSADRIGHCWPWEQQMGIIWTRGILSTRSSVAFRKWAITTIEPEVLQLFGGLHHHDEGEIAAFFMLTNACSHTNVLDGPAAEPRMAPTMLLTDAETVVALNWLLTAGLRLHGTAIHAHPDDEGVGCRPLTDDMATSITNAQSAIREWLTAHHGERFLLMMERLTWNADLTFSVGVSGEGDDREPVDLLLGQPPVQPFL